MFTSAGLRRLRMAVPLSAAVALATMLAPLPASAASGAWISCFIVFLSQQALQRSAPVSERGIEPLVRLKPALPQGDFVLSTVKG